MYSQDEIKKLVATKAIELVEEDMTIGIGTGTTAFWLITALAEKLKKGFSCKAVPTSKKTASLAAEKRIPLLTLNDVTTIDITIDGADEIDPQLQLIKGGGGALLQEKMVAAASRQLIIIADHTKQVQQLGAFPLPVEVVPYGWKQVQRRIEHDFHITTALRQKDNQPFLTDHGHYILDCHFKTIPDAAALNTSLHLMPGVVETGLFIHMATKAIIGYADGRVEVVIG
jgi:ribose 5-phosphate isomerase A